MSVLDKPATAGALEAFSPVSELPGRAAKRGWIDVLVLLLVLIASLGAVFGGPALGDHEALVAQCARDMRVSGEWLVPHYLGEPYVRKPPLPYWMIAGLSYVFPADSHTGLPVTTTLARLPSALAAFGTVIALWALASGMFGRRVGRVTAVIGASCLFMLLYAANATVEMILTFCCTWAYAHFWFAIHHPVGSGRRKLHLFFFYLAMGLGMMAKGPFPLVMVAFPIAVWWYTERAFGLLAEDALSIRQMLSRYGRAGTKLAFREATTALGAALVRVLSDFWPRTVQAFRELWIVPGLIVFGLCFVPWMIAVGMRHEHAWDLWNWQYMQRAQGKYEDTRPRGFFYYVPRIAGLILPWLFLAFEAAASPWISKYARYRKALLLAGLWALLGALIMSAIEFKKPYYVAPMIPGLILLMGIVADRFYSSPIMRPKAAWGLWVVAALAGAGAVIAGYFILRREMPGAEAPLTAVAAGTFVLMMIAGAVLISGRGWTAFGLTAVTAILAFHVTWYFCGHLLDNTAKVDALNEVFVKQGVPADAKIAWVSRRQDSRLSFYHNRITEQMIQPAEIVELFVDRTKRKEDLQRLVMDRAQSLLDSPQPVYLILDRDEYSLAKIFGIGKDAHILGFARDESKKDSDWMVISNVPKKP